MQKITYFQNCHGNNKNNVSSVLHLTLSSLRFALKSKLFQALSRHLYNVKHIISDSKWYRMRFVIYPLFFHFRSVCSKNVLNCYIDLSHRYTIMRQSGPSDNRCIDVFTILIGYQVVFESS